LSFSDSGIPYFVVQSLALYPKQKIILEIAVTLSLDSLEFEFLSKKRHIHQDPVDFVGTYMPELAEFMGIS
jgi:hypothetical protein